MAKTPTLAPTTDKDHHPIHTRARVAHRRPTHRPPKEQPASCVAVRAFPARFVYQDKHGAITNSDTTQCVDPRRVFVCSSLHPVEYQEEGRRLRAPSDFCCSCLVRLALARELPSLCRLLTKTSPKEQILATRSAPVHSEVGDHPTRRSIAIYRGSQKIYDPAGMEMRRRSATTNTGE